MSSSDRLMKKFIKFRKSKVGACLAQPEEHAFGGVKCLQTFRQCGELVPPHVQVLQTLELAKLCWQTLQLITAHILSAQNRRTTAAHYLCKYSITPRAYGLV